MTANLQLTSRGRRWRHVCWSWCRRRRRRRRRRREPQHRASGEERIHLVPVVAARPDNPRAPLPAEVLRYQRDYVPEAAPAVVRRHVRRALGQPVDGGVGGIEGLLPRGEPPGRVRRRVAAGGVEEGGGGGVEHLRRRARVLRVHEQHGAPVVRGGGEEVAVGEAEVAEVVDDEHVLVVGAQLLAPLEGVVDAGLAGGGVGDVAAAERERVDDVRDGAEAAGREEGGGGVLGEGGGELAEVGLVRAVRREVAALPAELPRLGRRHRRDEEERGGEEAAYAVARHGRGDPSSPHLVGWRKVVTQAM